MTWVSTAPNLLPVDPVTGGQARFQDWYDTTGALTDGDVDTGTYTLARDAWITTSNVAGGISAVRIHATPGRAYTAAVTASGFVVVTLLWVMDDGTLIAGTSQAGSGRVAAVDIAPPNTAGVVLEIDAPTARVTSTTTISYTVSFWSRTQEGPWFYDADPAHESTVVQLSQVVLVGFPSDPGDLSPTVLDQSTGTQIYLGLPQFMRTDDTTRTLRDLLKGAGAQFDAVMDTARQIQAGTLTDPTNAPDAWIPWMAQMAGVKVSDIPTARKLLSALQMAPSPGTRGAIAAVAQQYLTDSKIADVFPSSSNPFTIVIRVKADQLGLVGNTTAGLEAAVTATGQIPAGFTVHVIEGSSTWAQRMAAIGPWSDAHKYPRWADLDSIGVT